MDKKVLVPVDGSDATNRMIAAIIERKAQFQAPLTVVHVVNVDKLAYRMIPDFQLDMLRDSARAFIAERAPVKVRASIFGKLDAYNRFAAIPAPFFGGLIYASYGFTSPSASSSGVPIDRGVHVIQDHFEAEDGYLTPATLRMSL